LYRALAVSRACRIVEFGIGMGHRSLRLIEVARMYGSAERVRYTGIDLFEARPAISPGMTLKRAHRLFRAAGVRVRLIPGDPLTALARAANSLTNTDFVVIAADQDVGSVAQSMFYLPRMIHADTQVFVEEPIPDSSDTRFRPLLSVEISRMAAIAHRGMHAVRAA
jgi:hypothetical protein